MLSSDSGVRSLMRPGTGGTSESESSGFEEAQNELRDLRFVLLLRRVDLIEPALLRRLSAGSEDVAGLLD